MDLAYQLSQLRKIKLDDEYEYVGFVRIELPKGRSYILPFGSVDSNELLGKEKAVSELVERVTWFKIISNVRSPSNMTSVGFAAHTSLLESTIHSVLEYCEHVLLKTVVQDLKSKRILPYTKKGMDLIWQANITVNSNTYNVVVVFTELNGKIVFGLGSSDSFSSSLRKAKTECNLMLRCVSYGVVDSSCLSYYSYCYLQNIVTSVGAVVKQILCDSGNTSLEHDLVNMNSYYSDFPQVYDVSAICPSVFCCNRYITCCIDKTHLDVIPYVLRNGGIKIAIKI